MPIEVLMPDLGQTAGESTILRWLKHEGDAVRVGDPLLEVQTDKAVVQVEAYAGGTLVKILSQEGETLAAQRPIGLIAEASDVTSHSPIATALSPAKGPGVGGTTLGESSAAQRVQPLTVVGEGGAHPEPSAGPSQRGPRITPRARRLIEQLGLDPTIIAGTGVADMIQQEDVERHQREVQSRGTMTSAAPPATPSPRRGRSEPLSPMRQAIARRMSLSKQTIPHLYLSLDVDMGVARQLRDEMAAEGDGERTRLSITHLIVCAVARALREHPRLNVSTDGATLTHYDEVNVGLAVDLDDGLIVPVLHDADWKPLFVLAREVDALVAHAKAQSLSASDLSGGTFTVSNLGMFGVEEFSAIVNPPESAILAVGAIVPRGVERDGRLALRPLMRLTLSCDHRAIDGAPAARFLARVRELLERPFLLLLDRREA